MARTFIIGFQDARNGTIHAWAGRITHTVNPKNVVKYAHRQSAKRRIAKDYNKKCDWLAYKGIPELTPVVLIGEANNVK